MALPRLNESPQYFMTIPSTGKEVKFRPFLVREQKALLIAQESQDQKQILNSILNALNNCVEDVDSQNLSTFDVDYMISQIRSKSVGETSNVLVKCNECEHSNEIAINIEDIKIDIDPKANMTVELAPGMTLIMKYPTYSDFIENGVLEDGITAAETIIRSMNSCLDSIMTEDDNILFRDETKEEIEEFINSLTTDQFDKIVSFVQTIPTMRQEHNYNCSNCGKENKVVLEGLSDFFT